MRASGGRTLDHPGNAGAALTVRDILIQNLEIMCMLSIEHFLLTLNLANFRFRLSSLSANLQFISRLLVSSLDLDTLRFRFGDTGI